IVPPHQAPPASGRASHHISTQLFFSLFGTERKSETALRFAFRKAAGGGWEAPLPHESRRIQRRHTYDSPAPPCFPSLNPEMYKAGNHFKTEGRKPCSRASSLHGKRSRALTDSQSEGAGGSRAANYLLSDRQLLSAPNSPRPSSLRFRYYIKITRLHPPKFFVKNLGG